MSNFSFLNRFFKLETRSTTVQKEMVAGVTTFMSMVYSVVVIPAILATAGFPINMVFVSTCLIAGLGSILMGLWANLPMAIGCAISLTAFVGYNLGIGTTITIPEALGAIFFMGIVFTFVSVTGIRRWILRNIPAGISLGSSVGIGLFLFIIAATNKQVGVIVKNNLSDLPVAFGNFTSFSVLCTLIGLIAIIALEKRKFPAGILLVIVTISIIGLIFDPDVKYHGFFSLPSFNHQEAQSLILKLDFSVVSNTALLPIIITLVITAIFDATSTIRAVAAQGNLIDEKGHIIGGEKALISDSVSTIIAGLIGVSPAAVYIESATGTACGGKTGLTAIVTGVLFLIMIFFSPLSNLVPAYATAPALMYVGLLMLSNIKKLNTNDSIENMSGLLCAVFIVFTCNIVTGIMLGFATLVIGRILAGQWRRLNVSSLIITAILVIFYVTGWSNLG